MFMLDIVKYRHSTHFAVVDITLIEKCYSCPHCKIKDIIVRLYYIVLLPLNAVVHKIQF